MKPMLDHERILASAGSGKTYALTTRFIRLLAMDVPPERIAALTFTRKAAGEFFSEIVNRLARAAVEPAATAELARALGRPELGGDAFLRLLRAVVGSMHRLNLGTLDGFFARIVRSFPLELGLSGEPVVLDEREAAEEMRRVLGRLLAARRELAPEQQALIEAFKLATFGSEDKDVAGHLDRFIDRHFVLYRSAPAAECWGGAERIWPDGFPWGNATADPAPAAAVLREWAAGAGLKEKQQVRWEAFGNAAVDWRPAGPMPDELAFVLKKALENWETVESGCAELRFDRQAQRLSAAACTALAMLVRRVVALELGRRMEVTKGIGAVLRAFDALYDVEVRRSGRLTFADVQHVLAPARVGALLSSDAGEGRLQLDYRLDGRLDHWMFDEFQDTSFPQWQILQNLIDEVMYDESGRRSFFYVGDVKQAIYTWREGDPRLFSHVADRYSSWPGGGVRPRELNDSWRSGPAIVGMVNRVCGDAAALSELFPEAAPEWNRHWRAHRSARPERDGQAALLLADDEAGRWAVTLQVLQAIDPTGRGLTCAVLVQKNETGARLADFLRREGRLPAVAEADLHIGADNPVAAALAALLQAAAHPGDSLAQHHVSMSPLGDLLTADGITSGDAVSRSVLGAVQAGGFAAWMETWGGRLEGTLSPADGFSRQRLRQLVDAGHAFDATGSRDIDRFLRFLKEHTLREPEGAGVVRVMTIHKSKGLGFDVVVLPDLQGNKLAQRRAGPAVGRAADRAISWIIEHPGEVVASHDPVLRQCLREAVAENCYERLSLLYVALTRAKHGLYVVIEPPRRSVSLNFPRLLSTTLGDEEIEVQVGAVPMRGAWSDGNPEWHLAHLDGAAAAPVGFEPVVLDHPARPALSARTPSAERTARLDAGQLFGEWKGTASEHGRTVHALLAEVEWCLPGDEALPRWLEQDWRRRGISRSGAAEAAGCLIASGLAPVWVRPAGVAEVWRERPFEIVDEQCWVTGVLDRVIVIGDEAGRPVRAVVYDFKTDRVDPSGDLKQAARRHAPQLHAYRQAVARLTALPASQVALEVVFTSIPARVAID